VHQSASPPSCRLVRRLLILVVGLFAFAAAGTALVFTSPVPCDRVIRLMTDGDRIIDAVLAYRDDNGKTPTSLEELVPKYLRAIPRSPYGEWVLGPAGYKRPVNDEFLVEFLIDGARHFRMEYESLTCYVVIDKITQWRLEPAVWADDSGPIYIRDAAVPWNPPQPKP
jgi:hypothetical protein